MRGINYENPLSQLIKLQNKVNGIIKDVPLPHIVSLGLLKFQDIAEMYTFIYA